LLITIHIPIVLVWNTGFDTINLLKKKLGIANNGAILFTIDGLDFEKIFSEGEQPDFRPSYLKEALLSTSLSEHDIYAFGLDCYESECDNSWSGDANYSEDYIGGLIDQIKYYSDLAEASNKKFIIVTHSWGTVLGSIALGYLQDSYEVKPDLFITLSSPLGSMNNEENLEDPFWIYNADLSIFDSFEWLIDLIISGTEPNTVENWQTYIGLYVIIELNDIREQLNFEMPYLTYNPPKADIWINYWAMGDIISGPLDIKTKTIVPTESGDSVIILKKNSNIIDRKIDFPWTTRNFENVKIWHSITSLSNSKWDENNLSDTDKALADAFREQVVGKIISVINE